MSFSDETLMAFADGELDDITKHEVELAMRLDPQLAARVRQHQALRSNVFNAFAPTLDEAVPQRLHAAARSGKVVHLNSVRAARSQASAGAARGGANGQGAGQPPPLAPPQVLRQRRKRRGTWYEWGALAAALVVGVLAGGIGMQSWSRNAALVGIDVDGGSLLARGDLATSLSQQLASAPPPEAQVRIGVSFVSKDGVYCRSFTLPNTGGLACREGLSWRVPVMVALETGGGEYRQAGSAMPPAVLEAIDGRITGKVLDVNAERQARQQLWRR